MSLSMRIKKRFPLLLTTKVCSEEKSIEGVRDLHSLEILQNNLLQAKQHKENSLALAAAQNRSFEEDDAASDTDASDFEPMMSEALLNETSQKPKRRMLGNKRRSSAKPGSTLRALEEKPNSERDVNRPSSPDLELRDPAFFDSLLTDTGSPPSEPCFSFIFDPPYSSPPPSFWSLPNSAFSRGNKRQGSTGSYSASTPQSDSEYIRSSSLSLSSSTTRHSSEDEELSAQLLLGQQTGVPMHFAKCAPRVTKV